MGSGCGFFVLGGTNVNAAGIDVSKGKSMVAVKRSHDEVVIAPFEVSHTDSNLSELVKTLKKLPGETRVVMEHTGYYHAPVALALHKAGLYVSVINPLLVHNYGNNSIRRGKTDKKDAVKLANYALDRWTQLPEYQPQDDARLLLKTTSRQYQQTSKMITMQKNNLVALLDITFPEANRLFSSKMRDDGSEKWVDFVETFWHSQCVSGRSEKAFEERYRSWCKKYGYYFSVGKASEIYAAAKSHTCLMPKTDETRLLMEQAVARIRASSKAMVALDKQMRKLAETLPEYSVVMEMYGTGPRPGPQLMAEIGDVRRFHSKAALVAYAGVDAPPYQSGAVNIQSRSISRRGPPSLRRTLFPVMCSILQNAPENQPVYQFMDKKRAQGKPYKVYMIAAANKFLRIYYAKVKAVPDAEKKN